MLHYIYIYISALHSVVSGVGQGSVLGPILFVLFVTHFVIWPPLG